MGFGRRYSNGKVYDILGDEESIDKYLSTIKQNLLDAVETEKELRAEIKKIKDEAYASNEMQEMKANLEEMRADYYRGFPISEDESKAIKAWKKKHDAEKHNNLEGYHGACGGGYSYQFYPTGIGTVGKCVCDICRRRAYDVAYAEGKYNQNSYIKYMEENSGTFEFQSL